MMRRAVRPCDPKAATRAKAALRRRVRDKAASTTGILPSIQPVLPRRWPMLLSRTELCEYLGLSWSTLKGVLTVSPIDMGASVIRYSRSQIDAWVEARPSKSKLPVMVDRCIDEDLEARAHEAVTAALDRARAKGRRRP